MISARPILSQVDSEQWRILTRRFRDFNYRGLCEYADACARRDGAASERVRLDVDGALIGAAEVRVRRLPVVGGGIAYISGGPFTRQGEGEDACAFRSAVAALREEYALRRGLSLRIMAPLGEAAWNQQCASHLQEEGFTPARWPRPYRTLVVRADRPLDEIRESFSKNWRKNLRRGERAGGLSVRVATGDEPMSVVRRLHQKLVERKAFSVGLTGEFYASVQERLSDEDKFITILVEDHGEPHGFNLVSALGDTLVGILGATTSIGAKRYGAPLLEWAAVRLAHERGMRGYDLGGIDPVENEGVYNFKIGMRGDDLTAAGPFEYRPRGLLPAAVAAAEAAARRVRGRAGA